MNDIQDIRAHKRRPASEEIKQNRAQTVNVGGGGKFVRWPLGLLGCDVARRSKCLQRSCKIAIYIEPFCEAKVAHHRLAVSIKKDVSRLKIAMQNSLAMSVSNRARNFRHQSHTFASLRAERGCRSAEASTLRIFHAEKRQALLTFTDLVNRKNVWMIETRDCFGFAPKAHQRLVRIHLMSENAFHRDDPAGVLLPRAINHSHAAAADFLQNFVMTKVPLLVGHVRFRENAFERLAGRFTFGFKSFAQETVDAGSVIKLRYGAAVRAFRRTLDYIRDGSRRP